MARRNGIFALVAVVRMGAPFQRFCLICWFRALGVQRSKSLQIAFSHDGAPGKPVSSLRLIAQSIADSTVECLAIISAEGSHSKLTRGTTLWIQMLILQFSHTLVRGRREQFC